jgi:hypothetical protein
MKKILFAVALVVTMSFGANAQYFDGGNDGFFNNWKDVGNGLDRENGFGLPLPGEHGWTNDVETPLGSGLLVLTALGGAYLLRKRKN